MHGRSIRKMCHRESHQISKTVKCELYHRQQILSLDSFVKVSTKSSSLNSHCLKIKDKRANCSYLKGACPWKKVYSLTMRQLFHNASPRTHTKAGTQRSTLTTTHFFLGFVWKDSTFLLLSIGWSGPCYVAHRLVAGWSRTPCLCYQLHFRDILWGAGQ